ncbi:MAG: hypothetical protein ABI972_10915 [Acidobacteriota bacterium]
MTAFYKASHRPVPRERLLELMTIESNTVVRKDLAACSDKYTRESKRLTEVDLKRVSFGHDLENVVARGRGESGPCAGCAAA